MSLGFELLVRIMINLGINPDYLACSRLLCTWFESLEDIVQQSFRPPQFPSSNYTSPVAGFVANFLLVGQASENGRDGYTPFIGPKHGRLNLQVGQSRTVGSLRLNPIKELDMGDAEDWRHGRGHSVLRVALSHVPEDVDAV